MAWFVACRPLVVHATLTERKEYRVFSEEEIETIGHEWDWASSACDSRQDAQDVADALTADQNA